ncbi:MFS transporter [Telmatospirillum sp. J64-1]|uniref:MFS transporter n=1 Tax=Telmatospirillum sp. J64-1 TaxID=2502183 RepID=UPI00115E734B|nr:MFS transporter [Telmatospirillum sp. J64-1]
MKPPVPISSASSAETRQDEVTPRGGLPVVLGVVTGVQVLATLIVLALATIAPYVAASLGIGAETVGYQVSLIYGAAALVSAFAGTVVRRWGACATSQAALLLGMLGGLGVASGSLVLTAVASVLIGAGYGLTNPAASHLLHRMTPPNRRNLVFSLKQTGVPIGGILAGLLLPTMTEMLGWQGALLALAVVYGLMAVSLLPLRPSWDDDRQPETPLRANLLQGPRLVWREPGLRALAVLGFCFSAVQLSLVTFTVTLLVKDLGWSLVMAGGVAAIVQACGAGARIFWGLLADRLGEGLKVLAGIGLLSVIASLATTAIAPSWPAIAVIALLAAFGMSSIGWNGVFMAEVARISPRGDIGNATGGALVFTFAGVVVGPSLFALLFGLLGSYSATFGAIAVFPLLGTVMLMRAIRLSRR